MDASQVIRRVRDRSQHSLRSLALRAATSHSTLSAYENGHKTPTVDTLDRIVRAAGFGLEWQLRPAVGGPDPALRGEELIEALELAAMFPARHSETLQYPRFGVRG